MYMMYKNKYMTIQEVAHTLTLSPEMVYKLVRSGDLPAIRIGSSWRVDGQTFDQWLQLRAMDGRHARLAKEQASVISDFRTALVSRYGDRVKNCYLFGSYARGDAGVESDLDVLVVLRDRGNRLAERKAIRQLAYAVTYQRGRSILLSTIVSTEQELLSSAEPIYARIRAEGKIAA